MSDRGSCSTGLALRTCSYQWYGSRRTSSEKKKFIMERPLGVKACWMSGSERSEHGIGDATNEPLIHRSTSDECPQRERTAEQIEREIDVYAAAQVSPRDAALDHASHGVAPCRYEAAAHGLRDLRTAGHGGHEPGEQGGRLGIVIHAHRLAHDGSEIASCRAR